MSEWVLIVRVSGKKPFYYVLNPGKNSIGRYSDSDIIIDDESASRRHAEIIFIPDRQRVSITDSGSTNGTFVNRKRLTESIVLKSRDVIRIGGSSLKILHRGTDAKESSISGTHLFSRDQVLEAIDYQAVVLYEVAERLNVITELDVALTEVAELTKKALGADKCKIILADQFDQLAEYGFPQTIAATAIQQHSAVVIPDEIGLRGASALILGVSAAMCIPVISNNQVLALIYLCKTDPESTLFDESDLQVATAISHQAALTIERMHLIDQVRREQNLRQALQRFVSPKEAEYLIGEYENNSGLPELVERDVSVLFADVEKSTLLAEKLGTRQFGDLLNAYYATVTEIVFDNGGMVRYHGDGVMAIFGMLGDQEKKEITAVKTGLAILSKVTFQIEGNLTKIQVGIGITTGQAVVGYVGNDQRVELTVLGETVNMAHRIQNFARPNRLFVDAETLHALDGKYFYRRLKPIKVRGKKSAIEAFEIFAESEKWPQIFS